MIDNIDVLFLSKLQQAMLLLDDIDEMIKNNPDNQQKIDYEISDYLHLIQNIDLEQLNTDKILQELKQLRLKRASHYRFYEIIKSYNANRGKLQYASSRENLREIIKNTLDNLNNDYRYRVLDDNSLKEVGLCSMNVTPKKRGKKSKYRITEYELRRLVNEGMSTSEIATTFGCTQSMISRYKKKYGIITRHYNKKETIK